MFDTFPWPQKPSAKQIRAVADAACELRALRRQIMDANGWSLRDLYRTLETPCDNKLRDSHATLDTAVRAAYGMKEKEDIPAFLLKLNLELAGKESNGEPITPPGLPASGPTPAEFVSEDWQLSKPERFLCMGSASRWLAGLGGSPNPSSHHFSRTGL